MNLFIFITIIFGSVYYGLYKYLYGLTHTPDGFVFLGTVHHPTDYFIYLSEFAQGQTRWITSAVLQSTDVPGVSMVRWVNVLSGRIWSLVGIGTIGAYQLTVLVSIICLLFLAYKLLAQLIPKSYAGLGLFLYLTADAFPIIVKNAQGFAFGAHDFWYDMGNPFNRFITVPHHLIGQCAIIIIVLVSTGKLTRNRYVDLFLAAASGFALAGINAIHLIFICGMILTGGTLSSIIQKKLSVQLILAPVLALIVGAPLVYHLKTLLSGPPYSQMITWEATHQLYLTPLQFVMGYGPVFPIAIIGLVLFFKKPTTSRIIALLVVAGGIGLFFSPIPELLMLGKVRFLLPVINLYLSAGAALLLGRILTSSRKFKPLVTAGMLFFYTAYTLPAHLAQITDINAHYQDPFNGNYYISRANYEIMKKAKSVTDQHDVVLVVWPFNTVFPGLTGRRTYFSEALLANDAQKKSMYINDFFYGKLSADEMTQTLKGYKITYVIGFPQNLTDEQKKPLMLISEKEGYALWNVRI